MYDDDGAAFDCLSWVAVGPLIMFLSCIGIESAHELRWDSPDRDDWTSSCRTRDMEQH